MESSLPTARDLYSGKTTTLFNPELHELIEFKFERTFEKGVARAAVQMIMRERSGGRRIVIRFDDVKVKDFPILDQLVEVIATFRGFDWGTDGGVIRVEFPYDQHVLFDSASVSISAPD